MKLKRRNGIAASVDSHCRRSFVLVCCRYLVHASEMEKVGCRAIFSFHCAERIGVCVCVPLAAYTQITTYIKSHLRSQLIHMRSLDRKIKLCTHMKMKMIEFANAKWHRRSGTRKRDEAIRENKCAIQMHKLHM